VYKGIDAEKVVGHQLFAAFPALEKFVIGNYDVDWGGD